jgi:hypothetical protein
VPDWEKVIVGDAFELPSHDFNFYRDLFLVWPFLLFTILGLVSLFGVGHDLRDGAKFLALSLVTILLARERFILIGGALGICAVQSLLSFFLRNNRVGLAVGILTGALFLLLIGSLKDYKPNYQPPRSSSIVAGLVSLLSLGFSFLVFRWIPR